MQNQEKSMNASSSTSAPTPPWPKFVNDPMEIFLSDRYKTLKLMPAPEGAVEMPVNPARFWEGCAIRSIMAGAGGYAIGMVMGGFFHTMGPMDYEGLQGKSTLEQIKMSYRGFGEQCARMGRGFARFGLIFASLECFFERKRGTHDLVNAFYAGCATGSALAWQGGPQATAMGCVGTGAFCAAIDSYMKPH